MRLPGWASGTVRVTVPKINIWVGLLSFALAFAGEMSGSGFLLAVGIGGLGVMPIAVALQWLAQWKFSRKMKDWPVSVQVMPGPDGERIAFVTSQDGTVSSLQLPDGYDPDDDQGEWLIRELAPELAAMIFDNEDAAD